MDGLRHPVGTEPSEVYWKRRLAVVIAIAVVALMVWLVVGSLGSTAPATTPTPAPSVSPSPSANPTSVAALNRPCTGADVTLAIAANPRNFAAPTLPSFDVTIVQVGSSPCKLDTAAANTSLLITSGSDRIFSSTDCPKDTTIKPQQLLLQPGAQEGLTLQWDRKRSAVGCKTVAAIPRPGTYNATLTIQGIATSAAVFTLS
jgi:hypothetical protein